MGESWQEGDLAHHYADLGEVRLHYVEQGQGPLVVLLHGFPELWYTWHRLIPELAAAGFRVVAPDQRGYNLSSKPEGKAPYEVEKLYGDVRSLIRHLGEERAAVVGHDWGGGPAWYMAMQHPEMVSRLVVLDSPHPKVFADHLFRWPQRLKSWYMFAFRIPWLPELIFRMFDHAVPRLILTRATLRKDAYTKEDLGRYQEAWSRPGVWNRTVNWYRALLRRGPEGVAHLVEPTEVPALILWGMKDTALGHAMAEPPRELVSDCRVDKLPEAGHFVHADEPDRVRDLIVGFLAPLREQLPASAPRA